MQKLKSALAIVAGAIISTIGFRDLLLFGGVALVGYGASMVYPPAAYIVPGVVLTAVAVFGVR
jgi:hypothetical protein